MKIDPIRYLLAVSAPGRPVLAAFAVLVAYGLWLLRIDPGDQGSALAMLLFIQMFAASTGYRHAAGRGHFDALLVSGRSRARVAVSHFLVSAGPGLAAWSILALAGLVSPGRNLSLRPGSLLALLIVSVFTWAVSLPLPRFTGGVLWTSLLMALLASREALGAYGDFVSATPPADLASVAKRTLAIAVCPFLLFARSDDAVGPLVLLLGLTIVILAFGAGVYYVSRRDYPLVEES